MSIVPSDMNRIPIFEVQKRGYSPELVDQYLSQLVGRLNAQTAMVEQLQQQVTKLRALLSDTNQDEQVGRLINKATQQAEQIAAEAESRAQSIIQAAQERADRLDADTEDTRERLLQQLRDEMTDVEQAKQRLLQENEDLRKQQELLKQGLSKEYVDSLSRTILQMHDEAVNLARRELSAGQMLSEPAQEPDLFFETATDADAGRVELNESMVVEDLMGEVPDDKGEAVTGSQAWPDSFSAQEGSPADVSQTPAPIPPPPPSYAPVLTSPAPPTPPPGFTSAE